jgi:hypothetical protein
MKPSLTRKVISGAVGGPLVGSAIGYGLAGRRSDPTSTWLWVRSITSPAPAGR